MPGFETEGVLTIGRADNPTARRHTLTSFNSSTASSNYIRFNVHNGGSTLSSTTNVLTLRGDNRVGIGTSSPSANLHVAGTARITSLGNGSSDANVVTTDASGNLRQRSVSSLGGTDDQNISGSGINTTSNVLTIGIEGGSNETVNLSHLDDSGTDDQNISGSGINTTSNILTIGIEGGSNETVDLSHLAADADGDAWGVNGEDVNSNIGRIGNVGIGTSSPTQSLHVEGNGVIGSDGEELRIGYVGHGNWAGIAHEDRATFGNYAIMQNSSGRTLLNSSSGQNISFRINNSEGAVLSSNGNFGIGTASPTQRLHVSGNARVQALPFNNGNATSDRIVTVASNGDLRSVPANSFASGGQLLVLLQRSMQTVLLLVRIM